MEGNCFYFRVSKMDLPLIEVRAHCLGRRQRYSYSQGRLMNEGWGIGGAGFGVSSLRNLCPEGSEPPWRD